MENQIAIIGDVHGKISEYLDLTEEDSYSVQVGDMGIGFKGVEFIERPGHYFIHGNHDNPVECKRLTSFLGRFGFKKINGVKFFFVSGALSIDKHMRREGISWWADEELSMREGYECASLYEAIKPDVVISHDCPNAVRPRLVRLKNLPTITVNILDTLLSIHKPKKWLFGHFHQSYYDIIEDVEFQCLAELEKTYLTIP